MSSNFAKNGAAAPTPEFDASVDGIPMTAYYVAGCCGARSFHGLSFSRREWDDPPCSSDPTPEQVLEGIVNSGVGGAVMMLTDVYTKGKSIEDFKEFVESKNLGTVTIATPVENAYTRAVIYSALFCYEPQKLWRWYEARAKSRGENPWKMREEQGWLSETDSVDIDEVFYELGGAIQRFEDVKYLYEEEIA